MSGAEYDDAIRGLRVVLSNHTLHGYHCARLTDAEMNQITSNGMGLPNGAMLHQRIQTILNSGLIEPDIADLLFGGMMPACGSVNIPECLFSALRYALARLSHRCSSAGPR